MSELRILGEFSDHTGLLAILRRRQDELNVSGEVIDDFAGFPVRYCQKLIGVRPAGISAPSCSCSRQRGIDRLVSVIDFSYHQAPGLADCFFM
jgi:hypothetical protein